MDGQQILEQLSPNTAGDHEESARAQNVVHSWHHCFLIKEPKVK